MRALHRRDALSALAAIVATVMAALPMIPGYFAIDGLHSTLLFATSSAPDPAPLVTGFQSLWRALFISVALVVGVIGPMAALQREPPSGMPRQPSTFDRGRVFRLKGY